MAAVVEQEAEAISKRTKAALAAAKARGTRLGSRRVSAERFAEIGAAARQANVEKAELGRAQILPALARVKAAGAKTLRQIAAALNALEAPAPRGGGWSGYRFDGCVEKV
jgi:DNA invertase Pin-like site-specific DNA recombinase